MNQEQFVPQGTASLFCDAPGWLSELNNQQKDAGPLCWKCRGVGRVKPKKQKNKKRRRSEIAVAETSTFAPDDEQTTRMCPVCSGKGYLPSKHKSSDAGFQGARGVITWSRRAPPGWTTSGPDAYAIERVKSGADLLKGYQTALSLLQRACYMEVITNVDGRDIEEDRTGVIVPSAAIDVPAWVPSRSGEQLCNLVGNWRILQRIGSHRWTTDDLVTAYVASRIALDLPLPGQRQEDSARTEKGKRSTRMRYLDLGTGNASVLQMTCWALWNEYECLEAYGVEARAEAVGLARRSLSFNIGDTCGGKRSAKVVHSDFRDINDRKITGASRDSNNTNANLLRKVHSSEFDLITGTPPYFRVDFTTESDRSSVKSATIVQGGMPTSIQSAPARCEFRGGVEAYCSTAASVLSPKGSFVVCENWLNNGRVYEGARKAGLSVVAVLPIKGKEGRKNNLFGVYVMRKTPEGGHHDKLMDLPPLAVRDGNGGWTKEYSLILDFMSIPRM